MFFEMMTLPHNGISEANPEGRSEANPGREK